jgi:hypothetical protein
MAIKAHLLTHNEILTLRNSLDGVLRAKQENPHLPVRLEVERSRLTFQVEGWHPLNMTLDLKRPS